MKGARVAILVVLCGLACAKEAPRTAVSTSPGAAPEAAPADTAGAGAEVQRPAVEAEQADDDEAKLREDPPQAAASLDELTASLDRLEVELRDEGVRLRTYRKPGVKKGHPRRDPTTMKPATRPTAPAPAKDEEPCLRVCAIATAVCGLRERICGLAQEHDDEPRYAALCTRAQRDCTRATEACDDCG